MGHELEEPRSCFAAVTVNDVLLGDVWWCSGQSNMEFGLGGCHAPDDIKAADLSLIRHPPEQSSALLACRCRAVC